MTDREKEIIQMIDEVTSSTFGIKPFQVKRLKEKFMKAPFSIEEIRKKVEELCKEISEQEIDNIF